jgi:hypothetical protein
MFDKIPSLKDFIIYFMPGALICYLAGDLINRFSSTGILINKISDNSVLILIGIILSLLVGFLISQVQIIFFNRILKNRLQTKSTIKGIGWLNDIQDSLVVEIIKRLDIPIDNKEDIKKDRNIIFFCRQYIILKSNEKGLQFIDRSSHLVSFACGMFVPVILGLIDLFLYFKCEACWIVWGVMLIGGAVFMLILKIMLNFRIGWYADIFRQFLVLSKSEN